MKTINFVKTVSPTHYKSLKLWYIISSLVVCCLVITIVYSECTQLIRLKRVKNSLDNAKKEHGTMHAFFEKYHTLQQQEKDLQEKIHTLESIAITRKTAATLMHTIIKMNSAPTLVGCSFTPSTVTLTLQCATSSLATKTVAKLTKIPKVTELKLISLQPETNGYRATLQGTLAP